jgi:linoleoyl-CoA desaturase
MQKIKYSTDKNKEFIKELRTKVSDYFKAKNISQKGNSPLMIKTIMMFILYLLPYTLMMAGVVTNIWGIFFMWVIMGTGMAGMGMAVMHDASHGAFSKNKTINNILSATLYLLGGFPPNWKQQHIRMHHTYTNVTGKDEDIAPPAGILRFSPHEKRTKIHKYQHIYAWFFYGLMTLSWAINKDFKQLRNYQKQNLSLAGKDTYTKLYAKMIAGKLLYFTLFLVLPIIVLPIAWYWTVLFFIVAQFICGFILGIVFQTAHVMPSSEYPLPDESGKIEHDWAVHQLLTTADYAPKNKILSWYIGGLNFQVEHHLFPQISHVHYSKIAPIVKNTAQKYNIPYHVNKSFWSALYQHAKMLKQLGRA